MVLLLCAETEVKQLRFCAVYIKEHEEQNIWYLHKQTDLHLIMIHYFISTVNILCEFEF